jgi:hypothetical protein
MPSMDDAEGRVLRRLEADELRGRKGRSLAGSHRERGLFIASGPSVARVGEIDARMADATATLLARMGVRGPEAAAGRVLEEALLPAVRASVVLPEVAITPGSPRDLARTEARLRALGYVD